MKRQQRPYNVQWISPRQALVHYSRYIDESRDDRLHASGWVTTESGVVCFKTWSAHGRYGTLCYLFEGGGGCSFWLDRYLPSRTAAIRAIRKAVKELLLEEAS